MDTEDDIEDIKRLTALIQAETSKRQENVNYGVYESDSCEEEDDDIECVTSQSEAEEMDYNNAVSPETPAATTDGPLDFSDLRLHLTHEEYQIITECDDPTLKRLLILNRIKKFELKNLHAKYSSLLLECENGNRHKQQRTIDRNTVKQFNFTKVGHPYFRDPDNYPAPPNRDVIRKRENSEVNTMYFPRKKVWNVCNEISLKSNVMMNYFKGFLNCLDVELKWAKTEGDEPKQKDIEGRIKEHLEKKGSYGGLEPPQLWNDDFLNWEDIAIKQFNDVSSTRACRANWNLCLHPSINKTPLKTTEKDQLLILVGKYDEQNWEAIANDLNTNRSPYLLACLYFNKYAGKTPSGCIAFSKEQEAQFLRLIEEKKVGNRIPWRQISDQLNVPLPYLYHRYRYKNNIYRTGVFSESEDKLLMCLAHKYEEDFDKISLAMPHRKKHELKNRYTNFLTRPYVNYNMWTIEEDRRILKFAGESRIKNWDILAEEMNRDSAYIKQRYIYLYKKVTHKPDASLEELSRMCYKTKSTLSRVMLARKSVEDYIKTKKLPVLTHAEVVAGGSVVGRPQRNYIDHCLTDFFRSTAHIRKEHYRKSISSDSIKKCTQAVWSVLNSLGVELNIPDDREVESHPALDVVDVEVLKSLRRLGESETSEATRDDIPPNINSIQALRCLLVKCGEFKKLAGYKAVIPPTDDPEVQLHRQKFTERFNSLFRWPCLMSVVEPPSDFEEVEEEGGVGQSSVAQTTEKKKMGRPQKNLWKIQKMNEARKKLKEKPKENVSLKIVKKEAIERLPTEEAETFSRADEENVDDPDHPGIPSSDIEKRRIDLSYDPKPESSLIDMQMPETSPDINKSLTSFRLVTAGLNKNIQNTQRTVIRKVTREQLEEMKRNGSKFTLLKRPASRSETSELDVKKIKVEGENDLFE